MSWNSILMKVLLKKDVCKSHKQCMRTTRYSYCHRNALLKKIKIKIKINLSVCNGNFALFILPPRKINGPLCLDHTTKFSHYSRCLNIVSFV